MGDMAGLTDSEITAIAQAFLSEVEALSGQRGGIYIDASGARDILGASLAQYPLWVANYGVDEPEDNGKWAGWAGWQYTNQGRVPGVKGYVDRDYFNQAMFLEDSTAAPPVDPQMCIRDRCGPFVRPPARRIRWASCRLASSPSMCASS